MNADRIANNAKTIKKSPERGQTTGIKGTAQGRETLFMDWVNEHYQEGKERQRENEEMKQTRQTKQEKQEQSKGGPQQTL